MGVVKYCKNCNEKISIREMPNGYWIPFDFQGDKLHECKKYNLETKNNKSNSKSNTKEKRLTKREKINLAIKENKDLSFEYTSYNSKEKLKRKISPFLFDEKYVTGYCYLRKCKRFFVIDKMRFITIIDRIERPEILLKAKEEDIKWEPGNINNYPERINKNEKNDYFWVYWIVIIFILYWVFIRG